MGSAGMSLILAFAGGVAISGFAIVVGAISGAVIFGLGLAWIDSQLGITPGVAQIAREMAEYLDGKYPRDYDDYRSSVGEMLFRGMP